MIEMLKNYTELPTDLAFGVIGTIVIVMLFVVLIALCIFYFCFCKKNDEASSSTNDKLNCKDKLNYLVIILGLCFAVILLPFGSKEVLDITQDNGFDAFRWGIQSATYIISAFLISELATKLKGTSEKVSFKYRLLCLVASLVILGVIIWLYFKL